MVSETTKEEIVSEFRDSVAELVMQGRMISVDRETFEEWLAEHHPSCEKDVLDIWRHLIT